MDPAAPRPVDPNSLRVEYPWRNQTDKPFLSKLLWTVIEGHCKDFVLEMGSPFSSSHTSGQKAEIDAAAAKL